ncbi:MAG: helix-turn-helix domain-containing protein [Oscillospiraceae bacterium]|nr:helix-turn-helix domain-containing protein [Oscillospiraceae bacterium]
MSSMEKELNLRQFVNREYSVNHAPVEKELEFYDYVKMGDEENVRRTMTPLASGNVGRLSDDPIKNLRYHLVVTVALITRYCIDGGMEPEKAYTLSDLYINRADRAETEREIREVHHDAVFDFTRKMQAQAKEKICSKPVVMVIDYIYDHLHEKMTAEDMADFTGLSVSYISRLFHRTTGSTLSEYIALKRVEAAENMLRYSEYTATEIGSFLAFSSHSHFISVFKKHTGMTPNKYRERYFRSARPTATGSAQPTATKSAWQTAAESARPTATGSTRPTAAVSAKSAVSPDE